MAKRGIDRPHVRCEKCGGKGSVPLSGIRLDIHDTLLLLPGLTVARLAGTKTKHPAMNNLLSDMIKAGLVTRKNIAGRWRYYAA